MRLPMINPVDVSVEQIASMTMDQRAREPIKGANRGSAQSFQGQVQWVRKDSRSMTQSGNAPDSNVVITTRQWALDDAGYTPAANHKITAIAGQSNLALYVSSVDFDGELGTENTLVIINASTLSPVR